MAFYQQKLTNNETGALGLKRAYRFAHAEAIINLFIFLNSNIAFAVLSSFLSLQKIE